MEKREKFTLLSSPFSLLFTTSCPLLAKEGSLDFI